MTTSFHPNLLFLLSGWSDRGRDPWGPAFQDKSEKPGPGECFCQSAKNEAKRKALPDAE